MCGCRQPNQGHSAAGNAAAPAAGASAPAAKAVALAYRGARALLVRGPATGAGYACYPGKSIRVHAADAPHLLASGAFTRPG